MTDYLVVVNDEDQYSMWPAEREIPGGWRSEGFRGSKEECSAHVDDVWRDMRPRSLRLAALHRRVAELVESSSDGLITVEGALGAGSLAALGLTSMSAVRLVGALEEEFGLDAEAGEALSSLDTVDGMVQCLAAP